ncbi:fungal specific transcription factor domain-containing protein [Colletotrichum sojae]|uniref:Fungal specific transcription factor domain-containing protein n=1 Tax=Colletotrichum sojae TaxID=2175907 RepID=A0A8H6IVD0_9PEZI|nr:fungal specific transcription factor domain-containing protein [Colletotrichum sojae]
MCSYPQYEACLLIFLWRYLKEILDENKRLQHRDDSQAIPHQSRLDDNPSSIRSSSSSSAAAAVETPYELNSDNIDREISLDVESLLIDSELPHMPVPVSEATDTAFAMRFRQVMSESYGTPHGHIRRSDFATDEEIMSLAHVPCPWPSPSKARFLIEVALRHVSGCFHIVRRSCILDALELSLRNPGCRDPIMKCKLWALFGMGELYWSRAIKAQETFPGLHYFAKATKIFTYIGEQPTIDLLEIRLILSFYSLAVNRQYAAYTLAGSSVRMALIMGLHISMTPAQLSDGALREHRNRLWWTAHIMDCLWSAKLGHRPTVHDDDLTAVNPSCTPNVDQAVSGDFAEPTYYVAAAKLAAIVAHIIRSVYGNRKQPITLSNRVKQALKELKVWVEDLPSNLRMENAASFQHGKLSLMYLHLTLNQAVILSTRPILLYGLRTRWATWRSSEGPQASQPGRIHQPAMTLIDACIRCARDSCRTLVQSWIDGSFPTFDHILTQYLFSAFTILAISSLLGETESPKDTGQLEQSAQLLSQLKDGGNLVARELHQHAEAILAGLEGAQFSRPGSVAPGSEFSSSNPPPSDGGLQGLVDGHDGQIATAAGLSLTEPSIHEFLVQPDLDLQFLDSLALMDQCPGLYWPERENQTWVAGLEL